MGRLPESARLAERRGLNAMIAGGLPGGYDLVVLANLNPPAAMRVARMVRQLLGSGGLTAVRAATDEHIANM